jgi:hypothetical protein
MPALCYRCGALLNAGAKSCGECTAPFVPPDQLDQNQLDLNPLDLHQLNLDQPELNEQAYHVLRLANALNARDQRSRRRLKRRSKQSRFAHRVGASVRSLLYRLWFWIWRTPVR